MNPDTMITGRFDLQIDPDLPLEERVKRAVVMYMEKAGSAPNRAHVNPVHAQQPTTINVESYPIQVWPDPLISKFITFIGIGRD